MNETMETVISRLKVCKASVHLRDPCFHLMICGVFFKENIEQMCCDQDS